MHKPLTLPFAATLLPLLFAAAVRADAPGDLARQAEAVLKAHCYRCHGQDGAVEGGMNFILDRDKLVARKRILPGKADDSPLLKRVVNKSMPPADAPTRPGDAEVKVLRDWINGGAPSATPAVERKLVTEAAVFETMLADLDQQEPRTRRFVRYLSLAPLANAGAGPDELTTYRNAVSKLLNSLSWHPRITVPRPVDKDGVLLRIDLRDYQWDANLWNRLVADYPYGIQPDTAVARAVVVSTASRMPVVRADWFVATASRAPLYYDLLQMPTNLGELERQLRVDVTLDLQQERAARAGFNGSGISKNNRLLERHDAMNGAYWRTYDFDAVPQNLIDRDLLLPDRRNLFAYPLGPGLLDTTFQHAGGEAIFNLPNGLQGYILVDANNVRINKGPTAIVSDPKRPDRAVEAGLSCINCHNVGILPKDDQIRAHVAKNPKAFNRKDAGQIEALYPPAEKMRKLMEEDQQRFRAAVARTGNKVGVAEVVMSMTLRYEADVDLPTLAAEVSLKPEELQALIPASENLNRNLGPLKVPGGVVSRQVVVQAFADLGRALRQGTVLLPGQLGQILPDNTGELDPLEAQSSPANAIAFSADGRYAAIASADKSVRLHDVEAGRDVKLFIGHTASVWAVAFSPDGRRVASGGKDGTVRLWDVSTGLEVKRLEGHTDLVTCLTFLPDGRLLSAGLDHEVILWDTARGEVDKWVKGPWRFVNALAVTPNGKWFAIAERDAIHYVDASDPTKATKLTGHTGWVTSLAVTADGKRLLSGGDDGTLRVWDLPGRKLEKTIAAHASGVKSVAAAPEGKHALTGGTDRTVRLWDLEAGGELRTFGKHTEPLVAVAFVKSALATLSGSKDAAVHVWKPKLAAVPTPPDPARPPVPDPPAATPPNLKPARVIPVGGTVGALRFDPAREALYYLNLTDAKVGKIDTATLRRVAELKVEDGTDTLALSPGGTRLIATAVRDKTGGVVQVFDPAALKLADAFPIFAKPYDVAVTDAGVAFATGRDGDWSEVTVISLDAKRVTARWGGVWNRSPLQLSPDLKHLYYASQGVTPGTFEALTIPGNFADKPAVGKAPAAAVKHFAGGEFLLTPDGRFAVFKKGQVLKLAPGTDGDMTPHEALPPWAAACADEKGQTLFTIDRDGVLAVYRLPTFERVSTHKLNLIPYHVAHDAATGRLYVAGLDPHSVADRPRARGFGDVFVFELKKE